MSNRKADNKRSKAAALFEDEDGGRGEDNLKINEEFAKKFEHNKRRELLDKAKQKYGERALLEDS